DEERDKMTELLSAGFIDTFRYFYPEKEDAYTWWSNFSKARERNIGWRIDYFITSSSFEKSLLDAVIYPEIYGSDHCPIGLIIK
ncbi:MAG TPA: exodeoxyribonuclease III, partial [Clostridiales bacterium]|nr:exodeoxyribonuclease III [Clostridiales bacterium]